jgi:isopenicillin-N N-acyltransferase-like protein
MDNLRKNTTGETVETIAKLPVLTLKGTPYQMGYDHGKKASDKIRHNLQVYFRRFKNETRLSKEQVLARAEKYLQVIRRVNPNYAKAMEGLALGSNLRLLEIVALNVRYELMYSQFAKLGAPILLARDGCTAFAALPEAVDNRHLLMGENWDWIPEVQGLFLKLRNDAGPDVLCFTEAGVVGGKIGVNTNGIGLVINGMVSDRDDWERLEKPFHVTCSEILASKTLPEAVSKITRGERSCSANFIIGQQSKLGTGRVVDVEAAPSDVCQLAPVNGVIGHTNHFSDPDRVGVKQILDEEWTSTVHRYSRINGMLKEKRLDDRKLSISKARELLTDHNGRPESVCRHENTKLAKDERYSTVVSVIIDLYSKQLQATMGSPCENMYQTLKL